MADQQQLVSPGEAEHAARGMDIGEIMAVLPHRYPFLLIDRVLELQRRFRIVAIKNVTVNEPFFPGHFPGVPVMPGVLIVEAIAQAGAILLLQEVEDRASKLLLFTGIEKARFRRQVTPGDQLRIEVELLAARSTAARLQGKAYVGDKLVAESIASCHIVSRNPAAK